MSKSIVMSVWLALGGLSAYAGTSVSGGNQCPPTQLDCVDDGMGEDQDGQRPFKLLEIELPEIEVPAVEIPETSTKPEA